MSRRRRESSQRLTKGRSASRISGVLGKNSQPFRLRAHAAAVHRRRRVREMLTSLWGRHEEPAAPSPERVYESREAALRVGEVLARMARTAMESANHVELVLSSGPIQPVR